jgi:hypothetical protein
MNTLNKIFLSKVVSVCLFVLVTFIVVGCDGSGGIDGNGDGNGDGTLYVDAGVSKGTMLPSGIMTFVEVSESGTPVDNATVRVNITPIPSESSNGEYELFGTLVIDAGDDVILDITHETKKVGAALLMPEPATITAPTAGGSPYGALTDINITWVKFDPPPDLIQIFIDGAYTVSGSPYIDIFAGTATLHTIPANTLKNGLSDIILAVISANRTSSLGADAASGSQFGVAHQSQSEPFDTILN